MRKAAAFSVLFAALIAPAFAQKGAHSAVSKPAQQPKASHPSHGFPSPGPRLPSAADSIERLQKMSVDERKRALQDLPERRQQQIVTKLDQLDHMDPQKREKLLDRYKRFQQLPIEKQQTIREVGRDLQQLPDDRRPVVRNTMNHMRQLPEEERNQRINNPRFIERFSPVELDIIRRGASIGPDNFAP